MMNPRHTCRTQLTACPGPCNPRLKTHYCHHHQHHHHRHREKFYDTSSDAMSAKKKFSPTQLISTPLLKSPKQDSRSLRPDIALDTSKDGESVSETSSFPKIALVKVTSVPRIFQPEVIHLSQGMLKIVDSSARMKVARTERESSVAGKIESTFLAAGNVSYREEIDQQFRSTTELLVGRISKALCDAKNTIARELMKRLKPRRTSLLVSYLTIVTIYAGIHILLAVLAWQTPAHHFFVSSQICGILTLLMWRITGTILI